MLTIFFFVVRRMRQFRPFRLISFYFYFSFLFNAFVVGVGGGRVHKHVDMGLIIMENYDKGNRPEGRKSIFCISTVLLFSFSSSSSFFFGHIKYGRFLCI